MVALRSAPKGWFGWLTRKPTKPTARGNAAAYKAGEKAFKARNGSTPDLQRVVRLSLEHDARRRQK